MTPYKINRGRNKRWPRILLFFGVGAVLLAIAAFIGIKNLYEQNLKAVDSTASDNIVFVLESGSTVPQIAQGLRDKKLIRSTQAFTQYVRSNELAEGFKAGTYSLKQSYDVATIVSILVEGKVDTNLFTILPGSRLSGIRAQLIDEGFSEAEVDRALNPNLYVGHPALVDKPAEASLEGYLYPDSYFLAKGETRPEEIIGLSLDEMAEALTPDVRAGIANQGLGVYQGIILASIVEREVGDRDSQGKTNDNRAKAAQVFLKRLSIGMMLQSNATDDFPADYDTYSIAGLPPGPISNVSASALQAVAAPTSTNYLYFVSGKDCVTRFSESLQQHDALKAQHGIAEASDNCQG